jgi:uncharacterized membrane protein
MFKTYDLQIKKILSAKNSDTNWKDTLNDHKEMITKIQQERLIHLLVTIFVGLVTVASSFIAVITKETFFSIFSIPLIFLFLGYLLHYRFLENTTQNWYQLEDQIKKYCSI